MPLAKINSEFLKVYIVDFLMKTIEDVAMGFCSANECRTNLKAIETFVVYYGDLELKQKTENTYRRLYELSDEQITSICRTVAMSHSDEKSYVEEIESIDDLLG